MSQALISVIIPVYKVEKYLDRCLESIVNQTYKNLEIILIDDGSPDNCPAICDEYAQKDSRIKVIHKENGGLSSARNAGLDIATGDYIYFLDSDDYIRLDCFEIMYNRLALDQSDMCIADVEMVDLDYKVIESERLLSEGMFSSDCIFNNIEKNTRWKYVISCGKIYRKNLFDSLRFPVNQLHEDEATYYLLIDKSKRISIIAERLYFYLQRSDSIMGKASVKAFDSVYTIFEQICFFREKGYGKLVQDAKGVSFGMILRILTEINVPMFNKRFLFAMRYYWKICNITVKMGYMTKKQKIISMVKCFLYTYPFNRVTKKIKRFVE